MIEWRWMAAAGALAAVAGCATTAERSAATAEAAEPPVLVQATCAACHAVTAGATSPIAPAPGFEDIANAEGLTRESLIVFLGDSHNYPDIMDVDLSPEVVELIADYMLTLRRSDYRRFPS